VTTLKKHWNPTNSHDELFNVFTYIDKHYLNKFNKITIQSLCRNSVISLLQHNSDKVLVDTTICSTEDFTENFKISICGILVNVSITAIGKTNCFGFQNGNVSTMATLNTSLLKLNKLTNNVVYSYISDTCRKMLNSCRDILLDVYCEDDYFYFMIVDNSSKTKFEIKINI